METITSAKDAAGPGGAGGSRPYLWAALIVIAAVFIVALTIVVANLLVDLAYIWLDPRTREAA